MDPLVSPELLSHPSDPVQCGYPYNINKRGEMATVPKAPLNKLEAFKQRMGRRFKWVSSFGNDFNRDYHVFFTPEEKEKGKVYYVQIIMSNSGFHWSDGF
jgi:predicted dithiol-disulfide oxidoreductase (DUF899 family)